MISRRFEVAALLLAGLGAGFSGQASAQALSCNVPLGVPAPKADGPSASQPVRRLPTASYTLALSWSPQYCRDKGEDGSFQCGNSTARFGFVLHGLWPDGAGKQWPQYCTPASLLPQKVVREMLCTTPSADLLQHEWAKHGTCGWTDPAVYFGQSRKLYQALNFPDMLALSRRSDLTVAQFRSEFAQANATVPGLTAASIRVRMTKDGWLDELWLCIDRKMDHARCRSGQQDSEAGSQQLKIWRGALGRQ
ncbi:MAG TPA: ribonuclease T [Sphingobium sp.]|uniref:ribonuclease T2 family protein n=1 Tax=Sphingobium sp. TaxID=1912891 RepID=UPI002ED69E7C